MKDNQIELSFSSTSSRRRNSRRQRRLRRAHWWFEQMRQLVNQAMDRRPAPTPRPEQIFLQLARCQPMANDLAARHELN